PGDVRAERGECLPEFVVDPARHAPPLLLLYLEEPRRERAQLGARVAQLPLDVAALDDVLVERRDGRGELRAALLQLRHRPAQHRLGAVALGRLDRERDQVRHVAREPLLVVGPDAAAAVLLEAEDAARLAADPPPPP